jgi:hypothetical protein
MDQPEQRAEIEARVMAEVGADLAQTTTTIMRKVEGPEWPSPVGEVEWGRALDGRMTFHVGDAVYYFAGDDDRIIEETLGRVRLLDADGVIAEREVVRPELN